MNNLSVLKKMGVRKALDSIVEKIAFKIYESIDQISTALKVALVSDNFTIVQIGAYIGDTSNDPIFKYIKKFSINRDGRIIFVEPVKAHFEKLKKNYKNIPNAYFENLAIAECAGAKKF